MNEIKKLTHSKLLSITFVRYFSVQRVFQGNPVTLNAVNSVS